MEKSNVKAMREALVIVKRLFDGLLMWQTDIRKAHEAVDSALAAPLDAHCRKCLTCPLREKDGGVPKHCEFAWSQMPCKEGGKK